MEKPIRILQRPCPVSDNKASETSRPPTNVKTLEQREADYAAARRRIMGSDSPELDGSELPPSKGNTKSTTTVNGSSTPRQTSTSLTGVATSPTPLMSIQAVPVTSNGLNCDIGFSATTTTTVTTPGLPAGSGGSAVQPRTALNARQGLAVVNVAQKLQQQQQQQQPQSVQNATRPVMQQTQQQQQQPQSRILTASASSPSILAQSHHPPHTQPLPLFSSQLGTTVHTGLLPTPPSAFNYSMHHQTSSMTGTANGGTHSNGGLLHSHSAALALMHQFNLFQPQYQQTLNGLHHPLLASTVAPTTASFNHFNFSTVNSSQSNTNQKHAHPSAFN